jgi:hypothetical protein
LRAKVAGEDKHDVEKAMKNLKHYLSSLDEAREAIKALEEFYGQVRKEWNKPSHRVLGQIARSPPITFGAGPEGFTEDYAVVELDSAKFEKTFKGNVIDLGAF